MAEQNELRVGNVLLDSKNQYKPRQIKKGVEIDDFVRWCPIRITEDALLKLGFKKVGDLHYKIWLPKGCELNIVFNSLYCLCSVSGAFGLTNLKSIKYIHQLQNRYLDLTGKELKILEIINGKK